MKITAVDVFEYQLQYAHGAYVMSHGRSQTHEPSLVVRLTAEDGTTGWGETCPHGGTYLPAFFEGEREAVKLLAPAVIGLDATEPAIVHAAMSRTLVGGMAAKSAIDVACWDLFGKTTGLSMTSLLGGRVREEFRVFVPVALDTPENMRDYVSAERAKGTIDFQLKVGNDPYEDAARVAAVMDVTDDTCTVIADANGGWNVQQAIQAAHELRDFRLYLEQPCLSLADCGEVRRRTTLPLIVDECVNTIDDLVRAKTEAHAGGVNIKPGRVGGPSAAIKLRDTAAALGMMVTIDETWGGALVTAMLSHLAASTPANALLTTSFFSEWTTPDIAQPPRKNAQGLGQSPTGPGLGVQVDEALLGQPVFRTTI
ncbi:mandelate racemase/muconate lactonizing enzyme family protein [Herbiconiux sp. YIM B11900]|uniref:mandelate racemase/muconate lactonizing enzyme family protein n=1 Tax=Herbiconiux sp. YIM B11900 TaxID=3404131 RepID=UPI003F877FBA